MKKILVPIDFSAGAKLAFSYAALFAMEYNAELYILNVVDTAVDRSLVFDLDSIEEEWLQEQVEIAEKKMEEFMDENAHDVTITPAVRIGEPVKEIIAFCKMEQIELIVIGANGIDGFKPAWLGGTAYAILRNAPCPVFSVKPQEREILPEYS